MSLHGVSGGFTGSNGRLPDLEHQSQWTRGDLENQLIKLLAKCGEEFAARARRRRRWKLFKRIAAGCVEAECALIGGEMAEHPGVMATDQFDLVGFAVGAVERDALLDGTAAVAGDVLVGIESPNLRSNGFSLARRLAFDVAGRSLDDPAWEGASTTLADEMLAPSVIYAPAVVAALAAHEIHAVAHVTGGGLPGNLPRVMDNTLDAVVDPERAARARIVKAAKRTAARRRVRKLSMPWHGYAAAPHGAATRRVGSDSLRSPLRDEQRNSSYSTHGVFLLSLLARRRSPKHRALPQHRRAAPRSPGLIGLSSRRRHRRSGPRHPEPNHDVRARRAHL